jgi:hypothetical protein
MQAGADGPVYLELVGRDGDVTRELGVADEPPGHYTFRIAVPEGGPRQAEIGLEGEEHVPIMWLSSPLTPFPIGPGTAQLAPAADEPAVLVPAATASATDLVPVAAAFVVGLAAVALALAAVLLLRRSRGAPGGRAADGAPGA